MIARNSTFAYKGRAVDVKQVGRELGVRYVLEGCIRKAGQRCGLRASSSRPPPACTYGRIASTASWNDVFELQDQITRTWSAIDRACEQQKSTRARKPTDDLDAYDLLLRGYRDSPSGARRDSYRGSAPVFCEAARLDPDLTLPHTPTPVSATHAECQLDG